MRMRLISLCGCAFIVSLYGCAGFVASDINKAMEIRQPAQVDTKKAFDESKITFIKKLRCYTYHAQDLEKNKEGDIDIDRILLDDAGRKIRIYDEAVERVRLSYSIKDFSAGEKAALYATAAWVGTVGLAFGVAEHIAMLPALPFVLHLANKYPKEAFEYYSEGQGLLDQERYSEARHKFFLALAS